MSEDLIGTRGAFVLDEALNILGKVPIKELDDTLENIGSEVFAVILDGPVEQKLVKLAESKKIKLLIGKTSTVKASDVGILTIDRL